MERRKATCMHCGERLVETKAQWATVVTQLPAGWMSAESGTFECIPAEYPGRQVVLHTPMPEGLRGAPE
jgi:hypothetical protein